MANPMICTVLQPIRRSMDDADTLQPGTVVDTTGWANRAVLIDQGFLMTGGELPGSGVAKTPARAKTTRTSSKAKPDS